MFLDKSARWDLYLPERSIGIVLSWEALETRSCSEEIWKDG